MSDTVVIAAPKPIRSPAELAAVWRWAAITAAIFSIVVGVAMVFAHLEHKSSDPWRSPELLKLKARLRDEPHNDALKTQIREMDLQLRQRYFHLLSLKASGVYLLCGGAAVFLIAAGQVRRIHRRPSMPKLNPLAAEQLVKARRESRLAIAGCGAVIVTVLFATAYGSKSPLPDDAVVAAKLVSGSEATAVAADCATDDELRANWPGFRGFDGNGYSASGSLPDSFAAEVALWKSPVPAPGFNSPLVFGAQVFFTGGDATKREVICLDANTGALSWRQAVEKVPGSPAQLPEIPEQTGFCASTAATDGRRVYAWYANGDIAAFSLDGRPLWARHLATPKNPYGHATSLRTWRDRVIVQFDQGEPEDRLSKLLALDGRTGATIWEKLRPVGASWATPVIAEVAGKSQIITLAVPWVMSYDVVTGAELWRVQTLEGEITPSPIFAGGQVIVASPSSKLAALRPDGAGDVSKTHLAWSVEEGAPDVTSPVSNGELLFSVSSGGLLVCFEAKGGKKIWDHDLAMETQASPAIVGDRLLLLSAKGDVVVCPVGREFKELSRAKLEDAFFASPAVANGRVYLRGNKNVWCFGVKEVAHVH
ncbi:MAG: hypothetical protein RLY20_1253 [Verrucomicrobiota bacterium]|jgi:outer membrane protein assembly factor BamB